MLTAGFVLPFLIPFLLSCLVCQPFHHSHLDLARSPLDFVSRVAIVPVSSDARRLVIHAFENAEASVVFEDSAAVDSEAEPQVIVQRVASLDSADWDELDESNARAETIRAQDESLVGVVLVRKYFLFASASRQFTPSGSLIAACCRVGFNRL